jgi:hypothetical protein
MRDRGAAVLEGCTVGERAVHIGRFRARAGVACRNVVELWSSYDP